MYKRISFMLAVALALGLLGIAAPAMAQPPVLNYVPDVCDMDRYSAEAMLLAAGFTIGTVSFDFSDTVSEGYVIEQDPRGLEEVPPGTAVDLTVSLGEGVIVPDVVGWLDIAAIARVHSAGLECSWSNEFSDTIDAGLIIEQNPVGGERVTPGTTVYLTISKGPAGPWMVTVPDVVGMTEDNAASAINAVGLGVAIDFAHSDRVPKGRVMEQNPPAGTQVPKDWTELVELIISRGPEFVVPDVVGMPQADAEMVILSAGLRPGTISHEHSNTVAEGRVISQNPQAGTPVAGDSWVNLTISLGPAGPQQVQVPDLVGMTKAGAEATISSAGLNVGVISYEYSDTVAEGRVIDQYPDAGNQAPAGSTVGLTISLGPAPALNNPPVATDDAYAVNQGEILTVAAPGVLGNDNDPDNNPLTAQLDRGPANGTLTLDPDGSLTYIPDAGFLGTDTFTYMAIDDWGALATAAVTITVGGTVVEVPDVVGMAQADAKSAITAAGLTVGTINREYSDIVLEGHVISQNPASGTEVPEGSSVDLVISLGPAGPLVAGLVAHWKLDEMEGAVAYDSSACDNHGILTGNPQWVAGRINGALKFDGIDDYVDCGSDASLDITDQITIAVWVKTNDAGNSEFNPYVTKGDTAYGLKHHENNNIEFVIYDRTWYMTHFPVNSSFNSVWHHLAGTYDGSELKFYLDGTLKLTSAHRGFIASSVANVNIARDSEITDWFYDGLIDDVRIYRQALNADEIAVLAR